MDTEVLQFECRDPSAGEGRMPVYPRSACILVLNGADGRAENRDEYSDSRRLAWIPIWCSLSAWTLARVGAECLYILVLHGSSFFMVPMAALK